MAVKAREYCSICDKYFTDLSRHNATTTKHGNGSVDTLAIPSELSIKIALVIYTDVVKPICEYQGIELIHWDEVDKNEFYTVAKKIITLMG